MTKEPYKDTKQVPPYQWRVELTSATGKYIVFQGTRAQVTTAILKHLYPSGLRPLKER